MSNFSDQPNNFARILCGRSLADRQQQEISLTVQKQINLGKRPPCLAVILVGDNPASTVYVTAKQKACAKVGIQSKLLHFTKDVSQAYLVEEILKLNIDPNVDGILVQLPLPNGLDAGSVLEVVDPKKDVDGLTYDNLGRLLSNKPNFVPCTPLGCMDLIKSATPDITGKKAVVLGRSILVGRPMAILLEQNNATVTVVHSMSTNAEKITKEADIVVAAIGNPGFLKADYIKPGAIVIDVGITKVDGRLFGDVHESVKEMAGWLTPVPGGVGPMTITKLLSNTLKAFLKYAS